MIAKDSTDRKDGPFRLQISRVDKADLVTVNKITSWVKTEAVRCKGSYEGWETVIRKAQE